jgi:hypothetical protein
MLDFLPDCRQGKAVLGFSALSEREDADDARWLARGGNEGDPAGSADRGQGGSGPGVAAGPGLQLLRDPANGRHMVRFAFCKKIETLREAGIRLRAIAREA